MEVLVAFGLISVLVFLMHQAPGEAGFAFIFIFQYTPMFILFLFWLRKDILSFNKVSHIVRIVISAFFTLIFTICMINILYSSIVYREIIVLLNMMFVLPFFILFLFLFVKDIRDIVKVKNKENVR